MPTDKERFPDHAGDRVHQLIQISSGRSPLPSCEEFNRMSFLLSFQGVVFAPHLDNRDLALSISKRFSHSISHPTAKLLGVRNWNQTAKHADSNSL